MVVARIVTCAASISVARLESRGPPRIAILLVPRVWLAQVSPRDPAGTRRAWRLVTLRQEAAGEAERPQPCAATASRGPPRAAAY